MEPPGVEGEESGEVRSTGLAGHAMRDEVICGAVDPLDMQGETEVIAVEGVGDDGSGGDEKAKGDGNGGGRKALAQGGICRRKGVEGSFDRFKRVWCQRLFRDGHAARPRRVGVYITKINVETNPLLLLLSPVP